MSVSFQLSQSEREDYTDNFGKSHPRVPFTRDEDILLGKLVDICGTADWAKISKQIPGRNARQCRDRWLNYLSPNVVNGPWTAEEDELLVKKYEEIGPYWKQIATFFPTRTDINIKSRWNLRERHIKKEKIMMAKIICRQNVFANSSQNIINNNEPNSAKNTNKKIDESLRIHSKSVISDKNDQNSNLDKSKIFSNQQNKDDQNKKDSKTHKECENYFCDAFLNDFLNSFEYNYCPDEFFNFETDSYL